MIVEAYAVILPCLFFLSFVWAAMLQNTDAAGGSDFKNE